MVDLVRNEKLHHNDCKSTDVVKTGFDRLKGGHMKVTLAKDNAEPSLFQAKLLEPPKADVDVDGMDVEYFAEFGTAAQ